MTVTILIKPRCQKSFRCKTKCSFKPCCKTGHHLICNPMYTGTNNRSSGNKHVQRKRLGRIQSSIGLQLSICKQRILADHLPFAWKNLKYHNLHHGLNRKHPSVEKSYHDGENSLKIC